MSLMITSPQWHSGHDIPKRYSCDGDDISPPLEWSGVPEGTKSLVLVMDDPDAPDPDAPQMTWVHWLLYNLPPDIQGLDAGITDSQLPPNTLQGLNSWEKTGYGGPCPPIGRHRYFFKLYALDRVLDDLRRPDKDRLLKVLEGHIVAKSELMGYFQR